MYRPIVVLELPENVRTKLQSFGYEYVEDLEKIIQSDSIPSKIKTIIDEYNIAERISSGNVAFKITTGGSLWHEEFKTPPIAVFHMGLDKLLDGGLPVGRITELCGPPGCGKTQICLQFCVDIQIPTAFGGSESEALYICTDFSFSVERLTEITQASIKHCNTIELPNKKHTAKKFTLETVLNGVKVMQTYRLNDLIQVLKNLDDFLSTNPKINLVIIDSFSLPLVTEVEDLIVRSKITAELMDVLLDDAMKYKLAVVLTNQLTTIVGAGNKTALKPSLGEGFGHRLHVRLLLDSNKIYLSKSIKHAPMYTFFEITKDGIR